MNTRREPADIKLSEFAIIMRSVGTTIRATEMMYMAAEMLTPGRNEKDRAVNRTIATMVVRLLSIPNDDPEMVLRVLRSLPEDASFQKQRL